MKNLSTFFLEVKQELSKAVRPSWTEFFGAIVVVLLTMVFFAMFLGIVNFVFYKVSLKSFEYLVFGR